MLRPFIDDGVICTGRFGWLTRLLTRIELHGRKGRRRHADTLSAHTLRDIGLKDGLRGERFCR